VTRDTGAVQDGLTVHVGCAMWTHRAWADQLPRPRGRHALDAYARRLTAVEGNTTFYALPDPATVTTWASLLPPSFRITPKLPRTITHDRRLRNAGTDLRVFLDRIEPLHANLGPICVQLPASFGPDDLGVLDRFLATVTDAHPWAVEVRHPAFAAGGSAEGALHRVLGRHGVDRVLLDSTVLFNGPATGPTVTEARAHKPAVPVEPVALGTRPVLRLIGALDLGACLAGWGHWIWTVRRWIDEGRAPLVFVHTADNAEAPTLARAVHAAIIEGNDALAPLPEPDDGPATLF